MFDGQEEHITRSPGSFGALPPSWQNYRTASPVFTSLITIPYANYVSSCCRCSELQPWRAGVKCYKDRLDATKILPWIFIPFHFGMISRWLHLHIALVVVLGNWVCGQDCQSKQNLLQNSCRKQIGFLVVFTDKIKMPRNLLWEPPLSMGLGWVDGDICAPGDVHGWKWPCRRWGPLTVIMGAEPLVPLVPWAGPVSPAALISLIITTTLVLISRGVSFVVTFQVEVEQWKRLKVSF